MVLASCGGGGGGGEGNDSGDSVAKPVEYPFDTQILFETFGKVTLEVGEVFDNDELAVDCCLPGYPALNPNQISYASSNPAVASVDATGKVTAVAAGSTTIQASRANGDHVSEGSYDIEVIDPLVVNVAMGKFDSLIDFGSVSLPYEIYRSRDENCDFDHYALCDFGQFDVWAQIPITDTAVNTSQAAIASLRLEGQTFGEKWLNPRNISPRVLFSMVSFKGRLWVIGGRVWDTLYSNDIWSSADGVNWTLHTADAPFAKRFGHRVIEFNGKLLLIGGRSAEGFLNDVWESSDGIHWTQVTSAAAFPPRYEHQVAEFNHKLWLVGGTNNNPYTGESFADVWSSADGVTWNQAIANADFGGRAEHQLVVYENQLVLLGGKWPFWEGDNTWSTTDGINWQLKGEWKHLKYQGRTFSIEQALGQSAIVFNGKIWMITGYGYGVRAQVWSSTDGINWTLETNAPGFLATEGHELVIHQGKLTLVGGNTGIAARKDLLLRNAAWQSDDGIRWQPLSELPPFPLHREVNFAEINDQMFAYVEDDLGLHSAREESIRVFGSEAGMRWIDKGEALVCQHEDDRTIEVISFKGKLWWIGGTCRVKGASEWTSVLYSEDGLNWTMVPKDAAMPFWVHHQAAVYKDRLWVVGGGFSHNEFPYQVLPGITNDIWSSSDGITWELVNSDPALPDMEPGEMLSFNDKLWLFGGYRQNLITSGASQYGKIEYFETIWSSDDGINWQAEDIASRNFMPKVVAFNGQLIKLTGGITKSDNAREWSWVVNDLPIPEGHSIRGAFVSKGKLFVALSNGEVWMSEDVSVWRKLVAKKWSQIH